MADKIPALLVLLFSCAVSLGVLFVLLASHWNKRSQAVKPPSAPPVAPFFSPQFSTNPVPRRPFSWLTVRSSNPLQVQTALSLRNPTPCSWAEGLLGEHLFISPPISGWVLVTGADLPDPGEDIDVCYRFLMQLSRKLGRVQFFQADPVLNRHAWVSLQRGRVLRAYAWAGATLWNQGKTTPAEIRLGLHCLDYGEGADASSWEMPELAANVDRVPLLAAAWSLDPATVDGRRVAQVRGVAGEFSRRY
jgi:hypothetical protein